MATSSWLGFGRASRRVGIVAIALCLGADLGASAGAQTVQFRLVERHGRTTVSDPGSPQLDLAVQARVFNGPSWLFLSNFACVVRIVGEPESYGTFSRMIISNPDGTYAQEFGVSNAVGVGGIAAQYSYLAGLSASFNGQFNVSNGSFVNTPDQEIGNIAGAFFGGSIVGTPGVDADGDGVPDSCAGNGAGSVPEGTVCSVPTAIQRSYLGASGSWVDVYRFRYTVTNFATRTLVFRVQAPAGGLSRSVQFHNGTWGENEIYQFFPFTGTDLAIDVRGAVLEACCDPASSTCAVMLPQDCPGSSVVVVGMCDPNACPSRGACCDATGGCALRYAVQCSTVWVAGAACEAAGSVGCPPLGACCGATGSCALRIQALCPGGGAGRWQAESCGPNPCPQPGACCNLGNGCTVVVPLDCPTVYHFLGGGTACGPTQLCAQRACCDAVSGTCSAVNFWVGCGSGTDLGLALGACNPSPCTGIACCNNNSAECTVRPALGACLSGTTRSPGATTCVPMPCLLTPCCALSTGACWATGAAPCPAGTNQVSGSACDATTCWATICCNSSTGQCFVTGTSGCGYNATTVGTGYGCGTTVCPTAACCNHYDGSCRVTGPTGCTNGLVLASPATNTCTATPCPYTICCSSAGDCMVWGSGTCANGGTIVAGATACTPSWCPPGGKCCMANGTCVRTLQSACTGIWTQGVTPDPCRYEGGCGWVVRCCTGPGQCAVAALWACTGVAVYIQGSSCSASNDSICAQVGACCTGLSCATAFTSGCDAAAGGVFTPNVACTGGGGGTQSMTCCTADFDRNGVVAVADLFAFLSAWLSGSAGTDYDHDGVLGVGDVLAFVGVWTAGC